ncbi:hypothetical protein TNCV_754191 [Trichonephila clavipes]|nr:hypothetical protein TNCV_754191 [Trichonephila clavipes]
MPNQTAACIRLERAGYPFEKSGIMVDEINPLWCEYVALKMEEMDRTVGRIETVLFHQQARRRFVTRTARMDCIAKP